MARYIAAVSRQTSPNGSSIIAADRSPADISNAACCTMGSGRSRIQLSATIPVTTSSSTAALARLANFRRLKARLPATDSARMASMPKRAGTRMASPKNGSRINQA